MDPETIRSQRFLLVRRGYDPEAVLSFLDEVADALALAQSDGSPAGEPTEAAVEVADAQRLVDEARTRAATHRLRAQRDVEALERTARSRRARLVAEIEELATARDQLSDDLDRAVDVVDRVVQWVRRTDPAATPTGPVADVTAATDDPAPEPVGDEADDEHVEDELDAADEWHGTGEEVDPVAEATVAEAVQDPLEPDLPEAAPADEPEFDDAAPADGPELDEAAPDDESEFDDAAPADESELDDAAPVPDAGEPEPVHDEAAATHDDVEAGPADPATAAVRAALREVQDEVLGNLRDRPRAGVEEWVPASATLLALDDAATDAAARAFHDGWATAGGDEPAGDAPTPTPAAAREALEEVHGAGSLPGLGIADDLRVAIRASLQRGVDAGDATPQLVERLAEVHRDARQTRLDPALHDVLGQARHHGMVRRWAHDGVAAVRWVLGEERRCPGRRCRANATDGVVEPGDPFAWGEVVPPAHPGCTCTLEPAEAPSTD